MAAGYLLILPPKDSHLCIISRSIHHRVLPYAIQSIWCHFKTQWCFFSFCSVIQYVSVHLLLSSQLLLKATIFTSTPVGIFRKSEEKTRFSASWQNVDFFWLWTGTTCCVIWQFPHFILHYLTCNQHCRTLNCNLTVSTLYIALSDM